MNPQSEAPCVVLDASFVVALCAREPLRYATARKALRSRTARGCTLHAPNLVIMETLYVLCNKAAVGTIGEAEHSAAVRALQFLLEDVLPPPNGEAALIADAERIRSGYGCSHSADSMYIALAEQLAESGPVELLTFDAAQARQAAEKAPSVTVTLLASQD